MSYAIRTTRPFPISPRHPSMRTALNVRAEVMHFIFAKALALTPTARQVNSLGQMVNCLLYTSPSPRD